MTIERKDWGPRSDGPRDTPGNVYPHLEQRVPASRVPERSEGKIQRPDWGPQTPPGGRETVDPLLTPQPSKPKAEAAPSASRAPAARQAVDDVDERDSSDVSDAEIDAEIAAEELAADRNMLKAGFTREEIARMRGKPPDEVGRPKLTKASIAKELAQIDKKRRTDSRGYFKDEALQQRERFLIEMRSKLAEKASASKQESEPTDQGDASGVDPALLAEWEEQGGVKHHLAVAKRTVDGILGELGDDAADAFQESFDQLPESVQTSVYRYIGIDGGGAFAPATDAKLEEFAASSDETGELVKDWGPQASRRLGVASGRIALMLKAMSPEDRRVASEWLENLPGGAWAAVVRVLAGT